MYPVRRIGTVSLPSPGTDDQPVDRRAKGNTPYSKREPDWTFTMVTLDKQIADIFLTKLAQSKDVDAAVIEQLRILFAAGKKLRADDIVRIFSTPVGGDLK